MFSAVFGSNFVFSNFWNFNFLTILNILKFWFSIFSDIDLLTVWNDVTILSLWILHMIKQWKILFSNFQPQNSVFKPQKPLKTTKQTNVLQICKLLSSDCTKLSSFFMLFKPLNVKNKCKQAHIISPPPSPLCWVLIVVMLFMWSARR